MSCCSCFSPPPPPPSSSRTDNGNFYSCFLRWHPSVHCVFFRFCRFCLFASLLVSMFAQHLPLYSLPLSPSSHPPRHCEIVFISNSVFKNAIFIKIHRHLLVFFCRSLSLSIPHSVKASAGNFCLVFTKFAFWLDMFFAFN